VVTSDLSLIECERALIRATTLGEISEAEATDRRAVLRSAARHWVTLALDDEIQARAKRPFPGEPIRTLDAIHIATLLAGLTAVPGLRMLSLDTRVRASAGELGVGVLPA
jgi:predicted nucleic acid-binding protein